MDDRLPRRLFAATLGFHRLWATIANPCDPPAQGCTLGSLEFRPSWADSQNTDRATRAEAKGLMRRSAQLCGYPRSACRNCARFRTAGVRQGRDLAGALAIATFASEVCGAPFTLRQCRVGRQVPVRGHRAVAGPSRGRGRRTARVPGARRWQRRCR